MSTVIVVTKGSPTPGNSVVGIKSKEITLQPTIIALDCSGDSHIVNLGKTFPGNSKDYHITLVSLGDVAEIDVEKLRGKLKSFAKIQAPIKGKFNGYAMFEDSGDGMPFVLLYDSPQLPYLRQSLRTHFGDWIPEQDHGFTPHCTLAYLKKPTELDFETFSKTFNKISLWYGEEHYDYPLAGNIVVKGSSSSGNFGHAGRPGQVGGSVSAGKLYNELSDTACAQLVKQTYNILKYWGDPSSGAHEDFGKNFDALAKYKGFGYKSINKALRDGKLPTRTAKLIQDTLNGNASGYLYDVIEGKVVSFTKVPEDMLAYRAIGDSKAVRNMKFEPGQVFQDLGFSSTSLRKIGAETVSDIKVMMRINIPKGSRGLMIEGLLAADTEEYEWLLPMGSRFKVTGVSESEGITLVDMELLNG